MRITPLLCNQCGTWFQPKTKRKNRFCCNACRQANYNKKEPIEFSLGSEDYLGRNEELFNTLMDKGNPGASPWQCLELIFEHHYDTYCDIIYKWGKDRYGVNASEWLKSKS